MPISTRTTPAWAQGFESSSRERRILRSSQSLTSLNSSLSSLSVYTTTSSRTLWGPGALAGKALLALGKATIRGAEHLMILQRMAVIRAYLPRTGAEEGGHEGTRSDSAFMESLFDDVLELSRPELYPNNIRHVAMEIVLTQVASGRTTYLVSCLSRWLLDDLILLVLEIISVSKFYECGFLEPRLASAYASALADGHHPHIPPIMFISELMKLNDTTFEAAVLAKFPEFLLSTASRNYLGAWKHRDFDIEDHRALTCAFTTLSAPPPELQDLVTCTLEAFWPPAPRPTLQDVVDRINEASPQTWLALDARFLEHEASRMLSLTSPARYRMHAGRSVADAAYPRLQHFALSSATPEFHLHGILNAGATTSHALWYLICCVALGGEVLTPTLEHMQHQSYRDNVSIFSRMIYFLIPNTPESRSLRMRDLLTRIGGHQKLQADVRKFLQGLCAYEQAFSPAILDSVITLIIPLLIPTMDIDPTAIHSDLFRRTNYFPSAKRRPPYSRKTLRLFSVIKERHLATVIGEPGSRNSCQIADVLEVRLCRLQSTYITGKPLGWAAWDWLTKIHRFLGRPKLQIESKSPARTVIRRGDGPARTSPLSGIT